LLFSLVSLKKERSSLADRSSFAGSGTTAIALRAIFYYLLKHPKIYKEVQEEVDKAKTTGKISSYPTYAESLELPLLTACIKEAFRLHPSVALTMPRTTPEGGLTLCDTFIPAGWRVGLNGAVVHYDKGIFGDDADEYRPQRWQEGDSKRMDRYMLHFGAGTRICIGKNVSLHWKGEGQTTDIADLLE
jgi:cytochrome P450